MRDSELLGGFADNELSPECILPAERWLKPDGVCIPQAYSSYLAPLHAPLLRHMLEAISEAGKTCLQSWWVLSAETMPCLLAELGSQCAAAEAEETKCSASNDSPDAASSDDAETESKQLSVSLQEVMKRLQLRGEGVPTVQSASEEDRKTTQGLFAHSIDDVLLVSSAIDSHIDRKSVV